MRTIDSAQKALYARDTVAPIKLVRLITYSDREAGTVESTLYLSDRPVLYDYANAGTDRQFDAFVARIESLGRSMNHLPSAAGDSAALASEARMTLMNAAYRGGSHLYKVLRALNLEWCDAEIATVLTGSSWFDLRSLAGDEHVVHARGTLRRVEGVSTDAIQLRFATPEPTLPWIFATDASITDPKDLGTRLPIVYGAAKRVPAVNWQVGWTTTLKQPLAIGDLTLYVTDASGFPAGAFTVAIDSEEIECSAFDSGTGAVTVSARAQSGTSETNHTAGVAVLEIPSQIIIACAGHAASQIRKLLVHNPFNDELFEVPESIGTRAPALSGVVAGSDIAAVTFTEDQTRSLVALAYSSAQVTVQPNFTGETSYTQRTRVITPTVVGYYYNSQADEYMQWTLPGGTPRCSFGAGYWKASAILTFSGGLDPDATVNRYRVKLAGVAHMSHSTSDDDWAFAGLFTRSMPGFASNGYIGIQFGMGPSNDGYTPAPAYTGWVTVNQPETYFSGSYVEVTINIHNGDMSALDYIDFSGLGIEVDETVQAAPLLDRVTNVEVAGASVGYGLRFFADVDGPSVPVTYAAGYGFEESSGWSTAGCAVAADAGIKTEGSQSIKVTPTVTEVETCDSGSGWTVQAGINATAETTIKTGGTASLRIENQSTWTSGTSARVAYKTDLSPVDLSDSLFAIDVYIPSNANTLAGYGYEYLLGKGLTSTTGILIGHFTGAATNNYTLWMFGTSHVPRADEWFTLVWDPASWPAYQTYGSPSVASVTGYEFGFMPTVSGVAVQMYFDRFRTLPKTVVAQRNATSGTVDLAADALGYRVSLRQAGASALDPSGSSVYFSATAGSGTTPPAAYRSIAFGDADCGVAAWAELEATATDTGTPGVSDVETVGISLALRSTPPAALLADPVVWIDSLEVRDDSASKYAADVGDLIEQPADVVRHLLTERCGEDPAVIDDASLAALAAAMPDAKLAADLRGLGDAAADVLARIGYESRANIVRDEGASAATFRMLAAGEAPDYEFGASVRTITQWQRFSESGRDVGELAARFLVYYAYDPSLGSDETAYTAVLSATPEASDLPAVSAVALAAVEAKFGRRDVQRIFLRAVQDEATAKDVAGYYVREATRLAALWILEGVAWWEAYDLERGDIVDLTPPWDTTARKARVIEIVKRFDAEVVDVRVVEVP